MEIFIITSKLVILLKGEKNIFYGTNIYLINYIYMFNFIIHLNIASPLKDHPDIQNNT